MNRQMFKKRILYQEYLFLLLFIKIILRFYQIVGLLRILLLLLQILSVFVNVLFPLL